MMSIIVVLLALLLPPTPPPFSAVWQRAGVARLAWTQPAGVRETCLIREQATGNREQSRNEDSRLLSVPALLSPILIGCWYDLPPGPTGLTLGATGPMDASYRPQAGDVFVLAQDGVSERAQLRGVVYVASVRR